MTLKSNSQTRDDLDKADAVLRACWDNFIAIEPTYVLRDLIVMELAKAREAEREACATKAREFAAHYPEGSDGRNTFILLADWIDSRT